MKRMRDMHGKVTYPLRELLCLRAVASEPRVCIVLDEQSLDVVKMRRDVIAIVYDHGKNEWKGI